MELLVFPNQGQHHQLPVSFDLGGSDLLLFWTLKLLFGLLRVLHTGGGHLSEGSVAGWRGLRAALRSDGLARRLLPERIFILKSLVRKIPVPGPEPAVIGSGREQLSAARGRPCNSVESLRDARESAEREKR